MIEEKIKFNPLDSTTGDECDCGPIETGERIKPIKKTLFSSVLFFWTRFVKWVSKYFKK